jgi:hypothetical protein
VLPGSPGVPKILSSICVPEELVPASSFAVLMMAGSVPFPVGVGVGVGEATTGLVTLREGFRFRCALPLMAERAVSVVVRAISNIKKRQGRIPLFVINLQTSKKAELTEMRGTRLQML